MKINCSWHNSNVMMPTNRKSPCLQWPMTTKWHVKGDYQIADELPAALEARVAAAAALGSAPPKAVKIFGPR